MDGFIADPVHIGVYSATLDEAEFDFGEESEDLEHSEGRSRKYVFLKSIEEKIYPKNVEHQERLMVIKNQILEKVKATQVSRARSRSRSSITSQASKRDRSSESLVEGKSPVQARTSGIPKKTE